MRNANAIFGAITRVDGTTIEFEEQRVARLTGDERRVNGLISLLVDLQRRRMPAYVELDPTADTIARVRVPIVVRVESMTAEETGAVSVMFENSHARHVLPRDADFEDLSRALRDAKEKNEWIAVAETEGHEIIDLRPYAPPFELPRHKPPGASGIRRFLSWRGWPWSWFLCVSEARAQQLFDLCAATTCNPTTVPPPCIPFLYPDDGCWGRAHEMARLMIADGAQPRKVWIFGRLFAPTKNNPLCIVGWGWHVAPTLCVRTKWPFITQEKVIDPSLCTTPVTKSKWKSVQSDPRAMLYSEPASTFYRYADGSIVTDPTYSQTNIVLADYRAALQARSLGPDGPPPYAACT